MSEGTHMFGQGNDITAHRCHWMVNPMTDTTTHGTGLQFARPIKGGVTGKYPSMSGFVIN